MSAITTPYVTLEQLKKSLSIASDRNDEKLLDVLEDARNQVDILIKPYVDDVPLSPGTEVYAHAANAVMYYAKAHWQETTGQLDRAKYNMEFYEKKCEQLTTALKSDKPDRTKAVWVQQANPLKDRTYLVSELDQYITQEFT